MDQAISMVYFAVKIIDLCGEEVMFCIPNSSSTLEGAGSQVSLSTFLCKTNAKFTFEGDRPVSSTARRGMVS